jgi:hypothetical protein
MAVLGACCAVSLGGQNIYKHISLLAPRDHLGTELMRITWNYGGGSELEKDY